jgi:hypothetical protein
VEIVGRVEPKRELQHHLDSRESEFVVVYGRRRVGKTYLVREYLSDHIVVHVTGLARSGCALQIRNFNEVLDRCGAPTPHGSDWFATFNRLRDWLAAMPPQAGKRVVFLDEMPWMDTPRSGFIAALEHFWNSWAVAQPDIMLVVCGSATSWIMGKLLKNRGGLHNRVTGRIVLQPFTLRECEEYFAYLGMPYGRQHILESHMILGGVPFYLRMMRPDRSLAQNVDELCLGDDARLNGEFDELYFSLFRNAERHIDVVTSLSERLMGLGRQEIAAATGIAQGGTLTSILRDLQACGFIRSYRAYGRVQRGTLYQLVDPFTLFALRFMTARSPRMSWLAGIDNPRRRAWTGYAFESVCLVHVDRIKAALGISGVLTDVSSWRSTTASPGAQIDLVIDRRDQTINLCEMKYTSEPFVIDKSYAETWERKRGVFRAETGTRKDLHLTLVSPRGVAPGRYRHTVQSVITLDDLFT